MKRVAIITNKHAGKGKALQAIHQAKRTLWGWQIDYLFPTSIPDLQRTCRDLDSSLYEAAIVIGGDGTVNQALRGLVHSQVPLYPFPGGTANDLAFELGILPDWNQAQLLLDQSRTETIDLIQVNEIPFATVAGIGVGALLTDEFNQRRGNSPIFRQLTMHLKSQIYTAMGAKTILMGRSYVHHLHIKADIFDEKIKTGAVFICNQNQLGGDLKVSSLSENNDQKFRVMIVPRHRSLHLIDALVAMKLGRIPKDFIQFSTDRLLIRDLKGRPIRVFGDGEVLTEEPELRFQLIPNQMKVYRERRREKRPQFTADGLVMSSALREPQ